MRNAGLDEAQAGIKTAGRNINNLRYADGTALMAESREELEPTTTCTTIWRDHSFQDVLLVTGIYSMYDSIV